MHHDICYAITDYIYVLIDYAYVRFIVLRGKILEFNKASLHPKRPE